MKCLVCYEDCANMTLWRLNYEVHAYEYDFKEYILHVVRPFYLNQNVYLHTS